MGTTPDCRDTRAALASIVAHTLVLSPPDDLFNPSAAARDVVDMMRGATYVEIPSTMGHLAATSTRADDAAFLDVTIGAFLDGGRARA